MAFVCVSAMNRTLIFVLFSCAVFLVIEAKPFDGNYVFRKSSDVTITYMT